ncbi:MAG: EpsI family protein [Pseudomonadota bacterium]|jgi:EpsI family protein
MALPKVTSALIMAAVMALSAGVASAIQPSRYLSDTRAELKIEPSIPKAFGAWKLSPVAGGIVNPQSQGLLNTLYSEIVTRIYENDAGERVILSIAYGKNQNDEFQVHLPEICYPAQGFEVRTMHKGRLDTPSGSIPVRRLETVLNKQRFEPVTYWTMLGDRAVQGGVEKKMADIEYALGGYIADGLLFRVSSVDRDSARAFALQERFVRDLLAAVRPEDRTRLAGLRP